jgi:hypothetical protein
LILAPTIKTPYEIPPRIQPPKIKTPNQYFTVELDFGANNKNPI